MNKLSISVIVPTYKRVTYLSQCIDSILPQLSESDEVIVVYRDTDIDTENFLEHICKDNNKIVCSTVDVAGHLPPLVRGIKLASKDIVAVVDDDATVCTDWVRNIKDMYSDPTVGAIGGRVIQYYNGKQEAEENTSVVGKLTWYGKCIGNLNKLPNKDIIEVSLLPGGNMSYRLEIAKNLHIDETVNIGAAINYELDLCLQVRKLGYKVIYNKNVFIHHYNANRQINEKRNDLRAYVRHYSFTYTYILLKNSTPLKKVFFLFYFYLIGQRMSPGVLTYFYMLLKRDKLRYNALEATVYKTKGVCAYIKYKLLKN